MKQLLYILLGITLFTSCSSDDDPVLPEPTQDYTSFTVVYNANVEKLPNCVVGYKKDGKYFKIASLGDLKKDIPSQEVKLTDNTITEIYIFTDYMNVIRFDDVYSLEKNKKNAITIKNGTGGIKVTDKTDETQYPQ